MKASIVDLRYKMKAVLDALNRNESVTVLYHGKEKATINPITSEKTCAMREHPFFGMKKGDEKSVDEVMEKLRGGRF